MTMSLLKRNWGQNWAHVGSFDGLCGVPWTSFLGEKNHQQKTLVGFFGPMLGQCWANVGPCGGHVGAMLGPCWGYE